MPGAHVYLPPNSTVWHFNFTVAGEHHRRTTGHRDHGRAFEAATAAWLEACRRARITVPAEAVAAAPLGVVVARYLADLERRLGAREVVRGPYYFRNQKTALRSVSKRWSALDQVGPGWKLALQEWHGGESGVSWRTLQVRTIATRALLRWSVEMGYLQAAPELVAPLGEEVAAEAEERLPFTELQRDAFLRVVKKHDLRAWRIYVVLLWSAARRSDLVRMTWSQVDFKGGWLRFPPRQTKSKARDQVVGLHPLAAKALKAELLEQGRVQPAALVFGEFDFRGRFHGWLDEAKITDHTGLVPHHVTRHTTATLAGDAGASLAELMALGRWSTPQMAARYMRVNAQASKKALERL